MEQLALVNLSRSYGSFAVTKVCLTLKRGQILCLLGPSGSGKTTLLRLVAGLEKPDSGSVLLASRDVTGMPPHKRQFGMMIQELALFPHKSVFENVAFGLRMLRQPPAQILERTEDMLRLVGLSSMAQRNVGDLSGGEQQRVALARSLAPRPKLLMLDEVVSGLNPKETEDMVAILRRVCDTKDLTLFLTEHVMEVIMPLSNRVIVLDGGQKIAEGAPRDIANNDRVIQAYLGEKYVKSRKH